MGKKLKRLYKKWKATPLVILAIVAVGTLYFSNVVGLTHGISQQEQTYQLIAETTPLTVSNSTFLPHKVPIDILQKLNVDYAPRFVSAFYGLLIVVFFYSLASRWQTRRIALLSTALFASSSWMLVISRQGLPTILYLSWLPILALLYWTVSKSKNSLTSYLWAFAAAISLYIPGIMWFVAILAYTQKNRLLNLLKKLPKWQVISSWSMFVFLTIPFLVMLFSNPLQALASLGIPTEIDQVLNFPRNLLYNIFGIFIYGQNEPLFRLSNLPYLDIVTSILFLVGIYKQRYTSSPKMLKISLIVIGGWIIGIGLDAVNAAILLPVIYLLAGSGAAFLLVQWQSVFPTNPVARWMGSTLIIILGALIVQHHLLRYFVAWPNNPEVREVFTQQINDRIE